MLIYATEDDLANWLPSDLIPDDAAATDLRSASIIVAKAVNESLYTPGVVTTDPKRDATCAQVESWLRTGIKPGSGGLSNDKIVKARSVGTATVDYETSLVASVTAFQARQQIAEQLCTQARDILWAAGILYGDLPNWNVPLDTTTYPQSGPVIPVTWPLDVGYGGY